MRRVLVNLDFLLVHHKAGVLSLLAYLEVVPSGGRTAMGE